MTFNRYVSRRILGLRHHSTDLRGKKANFSPCVSLLYTPEAWYGSRKKYGKDGFGPATIPDCKTIGELESWMPQVTALNDRTREGCRYLWHDYTKFCLTAPAARDSVPVSMES